jgi:hypothetical protein
MKLNEHTQAPSLSWCLQQAEEPIGRKITVRETSKQTRKSLITQTKLGNKGFIHLARSTHTHTHQNKQLEHDSIKKKVAESNDHYATKKKLSWILALSNCRTSKECAGDRWCECENLLKLIKTNLQGPRKRIWDTERKLPKQIQPYPPK